LEGFFLGLAGLNEDFFFIFFFAASTLGGSAFAGSISASRTWIAPYLM